MQRERALQLTAQRSAGAVSPGLLPEQQLTKPPPKMEHRPAAPKETPAVKLEVQAKLSGERQPAAEEQTPAVKELEKQEVELLVWFCYYSHGQGSSLSSNDMEAAWPITLAND